MRGFGSQSGADEALRRVDWFMTPSVHGVVIVPKTCGFLLLVSGRYLVTQRLLLHCVATRAV